MDEEIKDLLATLAKEVRAQTEKIELFSTNLTRVAAKSDEFTVTLATALGTRSTTPTASMGSSVGVHDATPPSSGHSSIPIHTTEFVSELPPTCATPALSTDDFPTTPAMATVNAISVLAAVAASDVIELGTASSVIVKPVNAIDPSLPTATTSMLPARCATLTLVHDICRIPDAATPLCTWDVYAPSMTAPECRPVASLELDKPTPTRCLVLGATALNDKSTVDDALNDKSMGVDSFSDKSVSVLVALQAALLAGMHRWTVPKLSAVAHTMCSTKCSDINVGDTSSVNLHTFVFTENRSIQYKMQAFRPVPWPSFSDDTITFQFIPPWPSFKVASGGKFPNRTVMNQFQWCSFGDPRVTPSATQLLQFLGNPSSFPGCIFVNELCSPSMLQLWDEVLLKFKKVGSDIQLVRLYNVLLYSPLMPEHHVSGIDLQVSIRSSFLSLFVYGKQLEFLCGAEDLFGGKYGEGSTNISNGVRLVIDRGDVNLQDATGLQSLSTDLRLPRAAAWKGKNQVADNCNRLSQFSASSSPPATSATDSVVSTELTNDKDVREHGICNDPKPSPTSELVTVSARTSAGSLTVTAAGLTSIIIVALVTCSTECPSSDANKLTPASATVDVIPVLTAAIVEVKHVHYHTPWPPSYQYFSGCDSSKSRLAPWPSFGNLPGGMHLTEPRPRLKKSEEGIMSGLINGGATVFLLLDMTIEEVAPWLYEDNQTAVQHFSDSVSCGGHRSSFALFQWEIAWQLEGSANYASNNLTMDGKEVLDTWSHFSRIQILTLPSKEISFQTDPRSLQSLLICKLRLLNHRDMMKMLIGWLCSVHVKFITDELVYEDNESCCLLYWYHEGQSGHALFLFLTFDRQAFCQGGRGALLSIIRYLGHDSYIDNLDYLDPNGLKVIASLEVMFIGKRLCAPWDPGGGILQVFSDCGLRASRKLRRGECHVPTVTWVMGSPTHGPRDQRWTGPVAAALMKGEPELRSCATGLHRGETMNDIGIEDQT